MSQAPRCCFYHYNGGAGFNPCSGGPIRVQRTEPGATQQTTDVEKDLATLREMVLRRGPGWLEQAAFMLAHFAKHPDNERTFKNVYPDVKSR